MIPLRHTLPAHTAPMVNRAIVAVNVAAFIALLFLGPRTESLINVFGFIPGRLTHPVMFHYAPWEVAITLVTSLFLHGGLVHLLGNMIYLWVFGGATRRGTTSCLPMRRGATGSFCRASSRGAITSTTSTCSDSSTAARRATA